MYTHFSTPPTLLFALSISDKDHSTWGLSFKAPFNRLFLSPRSFFFLMDSKVETNLLFKKKLNSIKCLVPLWFDCRFKVQLTIKKREEEEAKRLDAVGFIGSSRQSLLLTWCDAWDNKLCSPCYKERKKKRNKNKHKVNEITQHDSSSHDKLPLPLPIKRLVVGTLGVQGRIDLPLSR